MTVELDRIHLPAFRRQDISWRSVGAFVEFQINLVNASDEPTGDTHLVIETAAFGAFVPFEPIARVAVAGFDPHERRTITARIARDRLDASTEGRWGFAGSGLTQWAGNVNVYFDTRPEDAVEVHRAFDLKVGARTNVRFAFILGHDPSSPIAVDAFSFEVRSSDPRWSASVVPLFATENIPLGIIYFVDVLTPPQLGLRAGIEVRVTRDSDGKTVPVEFSMETVHRCGDTIGCVDVGPMGEASV